jgi:hypothetical protein
MENTPERTGSYDCVQGRLGAASGRARRPGLDATSVGGARYPDRPLGEMLFNTDRVHHKQKGTLEGCASGNIKYPAGSPSTLKQAILLPDHCAVLCPSRYRSVLGLDDKQSFFNLFVVGRFFWKGERSL